MMFKIYLLVLYLPFCYSNFDYASEELDGLHGSQTDCVFEIASKYFPNGTLIYSVSVSRNSELGASTVDLDKRILENLNLQMRWRLLTKHTVTEHSDWGVHIESASGYILLINSLEDFLDNISLLKKLPSWKPDARFIIMLMDKAKSKEDLFLQMIKELWSNYVVNAIVLIPHEDDENSFKIVSWFPYANKSCGDTLENYTYLDTCNSGAFTYDVDLFPEKVPSNMNGCEIKTIAIVWPPFVLPPIGIEIEDDVDIPLTNGYEIMMMQTLEQIFNCKFIYRSFSMPENWGEVHTNGTFTGMLEYLQEKKADIGVGANFPDPTIHRYFDYSIAYLEEPYVFILPLAGLAPEWRNFLFILSPSLFIGCTIVYISVSSSFYFLAKHSQESSVFKTPSGAFLTMFALAVMNFMGAQPKYFRLRTLYIFWAYFNINLNAIFQIGLIKMNTNPLLKYQIQREDEIMKAGYKVFGSDTVTLIYSQSNDTMSKYVMSNYEEIPTLEALQMVAYYKNITTISSRTFLKCISKALARNIFASKYNILNPPIELQYFKGFPLRSAFDKAISNFIQAGLFQRWKNHVHASIHNYFNGTDFEEIGEHEAKVVPISLHAASGAFALLILGNILATIMFMYEYRHKLKTHDKTIMRRKVYKTYGHRRKKCVGFYQKRYRNPY